MSETGSAPGFPGEGELALSICGQRHKRKRGEGIPGKAQAADVDARVPQRFRKEPAMHIGADFADKRRFQTESGRAARYIRDSSAGVLFKPPPSIGDLPPL
jgi:hypothetical protein